MILRLIALLSLAVSSLASAPALDQRAAKADEWGYRPADGAVAALNPPSFSWVAPANAATYTVEWSERADFAAAATSRVDGVVWPTFTPDHALPAGSYHWRYRAVSAAGVATEWSMVRRVTVPASAPELPMPTRIQQRERVPKGHPRLFMRPEDIPRLRELAQGREAKAFAALRRSADAYIKAGPTPEPEHLGSARDKDNAELVKYWWPNREQAERACTEAETIAFVYLLTGDKAYGAAARKWVLHLASWDPKGTTNFTLNCEAGKVMLYRPARAYDWAWDTFTPEERKKIQTAFRARAIEAWNSGEVGRGIGHLQRPFSSHGNRVWHKLAEAGIAFLDEIPEAPEWLDYAVNKFFSCYPVWADDDGGWHEGVSYWSGYQSKVVWWLQVAKAALGIDGMKKPFFAQVGDYPLYLAPPNSPNAGFGDLSFRPLNAPSFMEYHNRARSVSGDGGHAGYWTWWAQEKAIPVNAGPLGFLYRANLPPLPTPKPPVDLPTSKVFHGIGVASLHTTLLDSRDDVHLAMKASPYGSQSHGHNPQNSVFLNAYGEALLVACTYRDLHGSRFHYEWVHSTRAQNAVLVDGIGQLPHSALSTGKIVREDFTPERDLVVGDATAAYQGRLRRALRHALLVKGPQPFVVLYDELEAAKPSTFQFMLHGLAPFAIEAAQSRLRVAQPKAGLEIAYLSPLPLSFSQTDGFKPAPTREFPNQWHVEASTSTPTARLGLVTVMVPHRTGQTPVWHAQRRDTATEVAVEVTIEGKTHVIHLPNPGDSLPARYTPPRRLAATP